MEKPKEMIELLIDKGEQYGKTTLELIKLKTVDKLSDIISSVVSWIVIIAFLVLFFTMANIAIALWLGDVMGKSYLGFLTVAAFYGLLTLLFVIFRKQLVKNPVNDSIVKQIID